MSTSASECGMDEVDNIVELKDDIAMRDGMMSAFDRAMAARYGDDAESLDI